MFPMMAIRGLALLVLVGWVPVFGAATQHTEVSLLLADRSVRPGDTTQVGVRLRMDQGWHTYWVNPGDSGGPTEVKWTVPDGVTVGALQWPVPEIYAVAGIITYVHHDEILVMAPLHVSDRVRAGQYELKATVAWLECEQLCLPGDAEVSVTLTVGAETVASESAQQFEAARQRLPRDTLPEGLSAAWAGPGIEDVRSLTVEWTPGGESASANFFALPGQGYRVSPDIKRLESEGGRVRLQVEVIRSGADWPEEIPGLVVDRLEPEPVAHQVVLRPGGMAAVYSGGAGSAEEMSPRSMAPSLWLMLWFALLGGLILNVMPCVLPVIALKVLGFLEQSRKSPGEVRRHGLIYGAGVLVSFLVLAGVVLLVQAGGEAASWGMQFQNPVFLVGMTTLVTLVALNLFGVFEVTLGGRTMGAAAALSAKGGAAGSFFNGVLATALATPCTAPFLGLALGFAFVQPPLVVLLMFLVVGLGLALPYVVISFSPGLARYLPKPGAWMERFKVVMGFPMAAVTFWLLSLLARHYGNAGVMWIGIYLVFLALAAWVWGQFVQGNSGRKMVSMAVSAILLAVGYGFALEQQLDWRSPSAVTSDSSTISHTGGIAWERWSAEAVDRARAAGRPVLVDFTADWCFTCRLNKETSLEIEPVADKLEELNAAAFLGDYTLKDPRITAELQRWGRAGVPLVLVYSANVDSTPRVLPELLTPGIVLDALEWAKN